VIDAFMQREDTLSWRHGTIAAAVQNQNARKRRDLVEWRDFLPPMAEQNQKKKHGLNLEEIRFITRTHLAAQR
jgi:hypothetical protein